MPSPEIGLIAPPTRPDLLRRLTGRLSQVVPGARLLAQDLLGADATIDFVALEPDGRIALVLVGEEDEDLALIGMAVAQRAWVEARLRDWLQLAPSLRIRPEAGVRVVLLCPEFRPQTRLAARALGPRAIGLVRYRCVEDGAGVEALVEHLIDDDEPVREAPPAPDGDGAGPPPPDRVSAPGWPMRSIGAIRIRGPIDLRIPCFQITTQLDPPDPEPDVLKQQSICAHKRAQHAEDQDLRAHHDTDSRQNQRLGVSAVARIHKPEHYKSQTQSKTQ